MAYTANAGGDTGNAEDTTQAPGTQPPAVEPAGNAATETVGERTLTQSEVNRIVEARLNKERAKASEAVESARAQAIAQWREEMGIDDTALEKLGKVDETTKEIRAHKAQLTKAQKERETLQAQLDRAKATLMDTGIKGQIVSAAASKVADGMERYVYLDLKSRVTLDPETFSPVVLGDDGEPDPTVGISQLVESYVAANPQIAKPTGAPGAGSSASPARTGGADPMYNPIREDGSVDTDAMAAEIRRRYGG